MITREHRSCVRQAWTLTSCLEMHYRGISWMIWACAGCLLPSLKSYSSVLCVHCCNGQYTTQKAVNASQHDNSTWKLLQKLRFGLSKSRLTEGHCDGTNGDRGLRAIRDCHSRRDWIRVVAERARIKLPASIDCSPRRNSGIRHRPRYVFFPGLRVKNRRRGGRPFGRTLPVGSVRDAIQESVASQE